VRRKIHRKDIDHRAMYMSNRRRKQEDDAESRKAKTYLAEYLWSDSDFGVA
jgi:hypothetical protein